MRTRATIAALVALLLLGACGSEPGPSTTPGGPDAEQPTSPDDVVSSTPSTDPGPQPNGGAQKVTPKPGMADVRAHAYEKVKIRGERKLRVFFYQGVPPCSVLDRVDVEYGTKTIGITLQVGHEETKEDVACIELAVYNFVDVALDEPVDGRKIVDASS